MNIIQRQSDDICPHCRGPFEIVVVKFGFRSIAMVAACPNCALAASDIRAGPGNLNKTISGISA